MPDRLRSADLAQRLKYLYQAAEALEYLHVKKKIVHRDIKTANLLLDASECVKLADFGMARMAQHVTGFSSSSNVGRGTAAYSSPEQLRDEHVTTASDVYSFGVVCYEVVSLRVPWADKSTHQIISALLL